MRIFERFVPMGSHIFLEAPLCYYIREIKTKQPRSENLYFVKIKVIGEITLKFFEKNYGPAKLRYDKAVKWYFYLNIEQQP